MSSGGLPKSFSRGWGQESLSEAQIEHFFGVAKTQNKWPGVIIRAKAFLGDTSCIVDTQEEDRLRGKVGRSRSYRLQRAQLLNYSYRIFAPAGVQWDMPYSIPQCIGNKQEARYPVIAVKQPWNQAAVTRVHLAHPAAATQKTTLPKAPKWPPMVMTTKPKTSSLPPGSDNAWHRLTTRSTVVSRCLCHSEAASFPITLLHI